MVTEQTITQQLTVFKKELKAELSRILAYWTGITPDREHGGFYGKIDNDNRVTAAAPKGAVLNARILWTFAAAYNNQPDPLFMVMANRAYHYILDHFIDRQYGGVYWSVNYSGEPFDTKKQVYAIAFNIYALSEFYIASKNKQAKEKAIELYQLLIAKAYDLGKTGYFEAFARDWSPIADLRLSDKDVNEKKTMNTHLHVLEAYTNLYRIWPDASLKEQIGTLLDNFFDHFIDAGSGHLRLFFDEDWNSKSGLISYGHDIEATWLLLEAAEVIGDKEKAERVKSITPTIADATLAGLDNDGGLWYEYDQEADQLIKEKHWWVQAEALVGFYNAWQLLGNENYLHAALENWGFIKQNILDKQNGEWFWGVDENGGIMQNEDKVGLWKCPYHNCRAAIELIKRIAE